MSKHTGKRISRKGKDRSGVSIDPLSSPPLEQEQRAKRRPWHQPFVAPFRAAYEAYYGLPWQGEALDYVQLARLRSRLGPLLTETEWLKAVTNYFKTLHGWRGYNLAELCDMYDTFRLYPLNRYRRPVMTEQQWAEWLARGR